MTILVYPDVIAEAQSYEPTHEVVECHDPTHCHRSPFQYLFSWWRNGHFVQLTVDGFACNVRVDEGIAQIDIDFVSAALFIQQETGG